MKIQIKSILGRVLFEYEKENNTIKYTVLEAIKNNANLRNANLFNANLFNVNLENVNLRNANLENANLRKADLRNANLFNANLENANLRNANLGDANLRNANLFNANLRNANLENANLFNVNLRDANLFNVNLRKAIKLPMYCKWSYGITGDKIHIGCEKRTIKEWDKFFKSEEVLATHRNTDEFKRIEAVYKALKAYYKHLNN